MSLHINDAIFAQMVFMTNKEELVYGGPGVKLEGDTKFECPSLTFSEKVEEGDGIVEKIQLLPSGGLQVGIDFDMT